MSRCFNYSSLILSPPNLLSNSCILPGEEYTQVACNERRRFPSGLSTSEVHVIPSHVKVRVHFYARVMCASVVRKIQHAACILRVCKCCYTPVSVPSIGRREVPLLLIRKKRTVLTLLLLSHFLNNSCRENKEITNVKFFLEVGF